MIYELLFSATGRSEKVLSIIGSRWAEEKVRIDLSVPELNTDSYEINENDFCIVNVSVFEGRIPHPALINLKKIKGNGAKALLVAVFGNRSVDDCLLEMKDVMSRQGFVPIAAIEASVQHSIVNQVCRNRPDADDTDQLKSFAAQVKALLESDKAGDKLDVPGKRPYIEMGGVSFKPAADESCIGCGLCAEKCPAKAIPANNPRVTDKNLCITCMRCVEICPVEARALPQGLTDMAYTKMEPLFRDRKPNRLYLAE